MMTFDIKACGQRIRNLRKKHDMTQDALAQQLNIASSHVSLLETGKRCCTVDLLVEIAELFHISLDYLILGNEGDCGMLKSDCETMIRHLKDFQSKLP